MLTRSKRVLTEANITRNVCGDNLVNLLRERSMRCSGRRLTSYGAEYCGAQTLRDWSNDALMTGVYGLPVAYRTAPLTLQPTPNDLSATSVKECVTSKGARASIPVSGS